MRIVFKAIVTALEPILMTIVDVCNIFFKMEQEVLNNVIKVEKDMIDNVIEIESTFIKNIFDVINEKSIINNASKLYYFLLSLLDIFLIGSIIRGEIIYIPIENFIVCIIIFIIMVFSILNLLLKHSQFNEKLKLFSLAQVLIILPIIVIYWIVSIEKRDFYLKDLDINQWSSIFNNMIIYFATCVIGIISLYKNKVKIDNKRTTK
ncbi:MAG: hypothetical protein E7310_08000 [Clostridiales bacterium]|nr:hypothetical protein [Clostridiales bacterium]